VGPVGILVAAFGGLARVNVGQVGQAAYPPNSVQRDASRNHHRGSSVRRGGRDAYTRHEQRRAAGGRRPSRGPSARLGCVRGLLREIRGSGHRLRGEAMLVRRGRGRRRRPDVRSTTRSRGSLRPNTSDPGPFVFGIAVNAARDLHRRGSRQRAIASKLVGTSWQACVSPGPSPPGPTTATPMARPLEVRISAMARGPAGDRSC
jgi:hypothetical protein